MTTRNPSVILPSLLLLLLCSCFSGGDKGDSGYAPAEGDTDTDTDADADTDADTDAIPDEPEDTAQPEDTAEEDCDDVTLVELFISPDDSNSMASPVMVRESVLDNWTSLNHVHIRTWEFMNYYGFDFERPTEDLAITAALAPDPAGETGAYILQVSVTSPAVTRAERDPMNLVLSLDTSGSMGGKPISLLRESCRSLAGQLVEGDIISMVTWDTSQSVVLDSHAVTGPDDEVLLDAIDQLNSGGGTDLNEGLITAYDLAMDNYDEERINRVILISDGGANVGITDKELIAAHAEREDGEGVYLMGVGVGTATSYNDALMDTVTDEGKGASVFIGSEMEAEAIFDHRIIEVLDVAARDVQVKLDLPPGFEITRFSGEEMSTDPREVEPQHLAPNDAMVFQQHLSTCAPELLDEDPEITVTVTWRDAVSFEGESASFSATWSELQAVDRRLFWKGEAVFTYAEALKDFRRYGQGSSEHSTAYTVWAQAQANAEALDADDEDLAEIRGVMEALAP